MFTFNTPLSDAIPVAAEEEEEVETPVQEHEEQRNANGYKEEDIILNLQMTDPEDVVGPPDDDCPAAEEEGRDRSATLTRDMNATLSAFTS